MKKLVLIGAGGHARSVVDSLAAVGEYEIVGFIDRDVVSYRGIRTIGRDEDLPKLYESGVQHAFVCVGYLGKGRQREAISQMLLDLGFELATVIDPSAAIADDAEIGRGSFVGKLAVVNANASIGPMSIINSGAVVEHDCKVGDFSHVSVNATLCGGVVVGEAAFVGAGATVVQGVTLGNRSIVGAGSVVLTDVPASKTVVGVHDGRSQ